MGIMKSLIVKDKALKILKFEEKQRCLKFLKHHTELNLIWWSRHKLSVLPGRKTKNRCIITGRGRSVNKTFKISRLEFRRWVQINILPGVGVGSW